VNSNFNQMAAQIPSGFGLPMCVHAYDTVTRDRSVDFGTQLIAGDVVRDRTAPITKGHLGLVATVPGTNAWSPPLC